MNINIKVCFALFTDNQPPRAWLKRHNGQSTYEDYLQDIGDQTPASGWAGGFSNKGWGTSKGNISGAGIAGIASQAAGIVGNALAGQNQTGVGNAMNTLGNVASVIPGPYGAIISGGLKTLGGLTNAAFGSHLNKEFIKSKNQEIGNVLASTSDAQSSNDFISDYGSMRGVSNFSKKDVGSDGWFSHKARNTYRSMQAAKGIANQTQQNNYNTVGNNINTGNTMSQMEHLTALGGPLEFGLMQDQINSLNVAAQAKNRFYANPNSTPQVGLFAFGGDVQGDGADYPTGLTHIDAGDTHENNPYEGVQMGVDNQGIPNLVEENEVVYGDYVFSNRLKVPKQKVKKGKDATREQQLLNRYKGLSYADAAKKIEHNTGVDERPNDPIAKRGFEADLKILAMSQEKERAAQELKDQKNEIDSMSAEEFAQLQQQQEQQEQEQAQEQQAQQQAQQDQLQQAMSQLTPEQQQQVAQLPPEQQQSAIEQLLNEQQQQQQSQEPQQDQSIQEQEPTQDQSIQETPANPPTDNMHAEGGNLSNDDSNVTNVNSNTGDSAQQNAIQQTNDQQDVQQSEQQSQQSQQEGTTQNDRQNAEDMSTSQLNQTIDQIIQWARQNGDRQLAREGRKARRSSREDKEDFVDDALDEIQEKEQQQQEQAQQEQQAVQDQQAQQQAQEQQVQQQTQAPQANEDQSTDVQDNAEPDNQEAIQAQAQDQGQQFANGGDMSQQDYIQALQSFMEQVGQSSDQTMQQYYKQYTDFINNKQDQKAIQLADSLYKQYLKASQEGGSQYAFGGSMNLNNPDAGNNASGHKIYAGVNEDILESLTKEQYEVLNKLYKDKLGVSIKYLKRHNPVAFRRVLNDALSIKQGEDITSLPINNFNSKARSATGRINAYNGLIFNIEHGNKVIPTNKNRLSVGDFSGFTPINANRIVSASNNKRSPYRIGDYDYTLGNNEFNGNYNGTPLTESLEQAGIYDYTKGKQDELTNLFEGQSKLSQYYKHSIEQKFKSLYGKNYNPKFLSKYYLTNTQLKNWINELKATQGDSQEAKRKRALGEVLEANWDLNGNPTNTAQKYGTPESAGYLTAVKDNKGLIDSNAGISTHPNAQNDNLPGIEHIPYLKAITGDTANRFFVKDGDNYIQVALPKNYDYSSLQPFRTDQKIGNISFKDYLLSGALNRDVMTNPYTNEVLDITGQDKTGLQSESPEMKDDETPLGTTVSTNWFSTDNSPIENPYPKPSKWPYLLASGLNLGLGITNALRGPDYANADAMINMSKDAGHYTPIGAKYAGQEYFYTPIAADYYTNPIEAKGQATDRAIINNSNGNVGAATNALLSNAHNVGLEIGDAFTKGQQYNNDERLKAQEFGLKRDTANYDRQLQADKANQDAELKARGLTLEGVAKAYALRQQIEDEHNKSISANLSGFLNPLLAYEQTKYAGDQSDWYLNNVARPGGGTAEKVWDPDKNKYVPWNEYYKHSKGGSLRTVRIQRPKGLMF